MSFFKKLASGASNFFKKAGSETKSVFHKAEHGFNHTFIPSVSKAFDKVGSGIKTAGNKLSGVGMKVGNFLEKNSGELALAGSATALALGQPELIPIIGAVGATASQFGGQLKQGSGLLKDTSNLAGGVLKAHGNMFSQHIHNVAQQAKQGVNQVKQQYNQNLNQIQASNNLATIHADLAN